jgi:hypothetical protein
VYYICPVGDEIDVVYLQLLSRLVTMATQTLT